MSLGTSSCGTIRCCFPRVSGDEPLARVEVIHSMKFSPRERG